MELYLYSYICIPGMTSFLLYGSVFNGYERKKCMKTRVLRKILGPTEGEVSEAK
jgi:hypothetical protein